MADVLRVAGVNLPAAGAHSYVREGLRPAISAFDGQIGTGTVEIIDLDGTLDTAGGREVRLTVAGTVILSGFLGEQLNERWAGDQARPIVGRSYSVQDANALLAHVRIAAWSRPTETDVERVQAALAAFRPDLDAATYIPGTHTVSLPQKKYQDTSLDEVFADAMDSSGKTWFVDAAESVHYHGLEEDVGFNASVSVSDDEPDLETQFAPVTPRRRRDPYELANDILVRASDGSHVTVTDAGSIAAHDADGLSHQDVVQYPDGNDSGFLTAYGEAILGDRSGERDTYTFRLENLPDPAVLQAGQLIEITSQVMDLDHSTQRIAQLGWETPAPGVWHADVECGSPKRLQFRRRRRGTTTKKDIEKISNAVACTSVVSTDTAGLMELGFPLVYAYGVGWGAVNVAWPFTPCGAGVGAWKNAYPGGIYYRFTAPADAGQLQGKLEAFGPNAEHGAARGWDVYILAETGPPTASHLGNPIARDLRAAQDVILPRGLISWGGDWCLVVWPSWQVPATAYVCGLAGGTRPEATGQLGCGAYTGFPTTLSLSYVGLCEDARGWLEAAPSEAADGERTTFRLLGWDGTGLPELRRNGLLMHPAALDRDGGSVTLHEVPQAGDLLIARYHTGS